MRDWFAASTVLNQLRSKVSPVYSDPREKSRFDSLSFWHYGERRFPESMSLGMQFLFVRRMRRQSFLLLFFLVLLSVSLSGCSFSGWFSRASSAQARDATPAKASDSWLSRPPLGKGEATTSNPQYITEEEILRIVGELQRASGKDTYRFPIPKDVTGANVYKATLTRLQDYEAKHPGAYPEIIAFTRARAYEGEGAYAQAVAQYQIVSQSRHQLKDEAAKAMTILARFQEVQQRPVTATTPVEYLQSLDEHIKAWQELGKQYPGLPYEALAREEEERLDRAKVAFLELNRHRIEDGNESVTLAYQQLLDKHKESKNNYHYQIEFADFYFTLAQEYVMQVNPQSLQFDSTVFESLGRTALRLYAQVAQEDGIIEKLEAKGKLEALEAYMAKVGRLAR
jgi:hypothetical protein